VVRGGLGEESREPGISWRESRSRTKEEIYKMERYVLGMKGNGHQKGKRGGGLPYNTERGKKLIKRGCRAGGKREVVLSNIHLTRP